MEHVACSIMEQVALCPEHGALADACAGAAQCRLAAVPELFYLPLIVL
ncbi:hypothetical protein PghCCS26_51360 [Paenibacillus glycanilyticus]|uniref:Uncharacterized protein n=1 Tax=Paenibacillus glycanilyticus TaxID=126569 RepID=A0ABQ6NSB7_9BACL|nr:hypothetical protein PghCCS26_51360 [Paenibacillus glycanilyticus]